MQTILTNAANTGRIPLYVAANLPYSGRPHQV